jgi:hypothetical protein
VWGTFSIFKDEQVSPTQILVLPAVLLPGRYGASGRPGPSVRKTFWGRSFRRRHLLFNHCSRRG